MDDDVMGILIAVALGIALVVAIVLLMIPEPAEQAVIATERLDVAVLSFGNSSSWPGVGETVRTRTETRLVNTSGVTVFSRTRLDALLTEQLLGASGLIDPSTAARIGRLTGVSKLVAGSVSGVESTADAVTICEEWSGGSCVRSVPGTQYTIRLLGQVEVLDAATGRIEQAREVDSSASTTVKEGGSFPGYETLIVRAADDVASDVASLLTSTYTRELYYGLYRSVKPKRDGYVGEGETSRFTTSDGEASLIVHFTRVREDETFQVTWVDPAGNHVSTSDDLVSDGEWRVYRLDFAGLSTGRYAVRGTLGGVQAFEKSFLLKP